MKKYIIILLLLFLVFQSGNSFSQKNKIRFMLIPIYTGSFNFGYASLSYEYNIKKQHAIGCQFHSNLIQGWDATRFSYNVNLYYRYYFSSYKKLKTFLVAEPGYYHLYYGEMAQSFSSNNYTLGALFGIHHNFNASGNWFLEISLGANLVQRQYYKQSVEYYYEDQEPPLPNDKTLVLPRMIIEVGFRF